MSCGGLNPLLFAAHSGHQRTSRRARIRSVHPARYQNASMGCMMHSMSPDIVRRLCLEWVNLDILSADRPLPVYPDEKTFRLFVGMSQTCQCTKSLRSSPLRGSKSREAGSRSRGQGWRGGKVNTISSCIVGVQRMIKNSKDHLAGRHPDAASHIDPARTQ